MNENVTNICHDTKRHVYNVCVTLLLLTFYHSTACSIHQKLDFPAKYHIKTAAAATTTTKHSELESQW
jgi:hypothetical protein